MKRKICQESNPRLLGVKQVCYLCAMLPPPSQLPDLWHPDWRHQLGWNRGCCCRLHWKLLVTRLVKQECFSPNQVISRLIQNALNFFADVCSVVRRRELGPVHAHLEAAEREGPGHHRFVHPTVPGIRHQSPETDPDLLEVLPEDQEDSRTSRTRH